MTGHITVYSTWWADDWTHPRYELGGFIWSAVKWSADLTRLGLVGLGFHSELVNQWG